MKNLVLVLVAVLVLGGVLMITGFAAGAQLDGVGSSLAIGTQREAVHVQESPISNIDIVVANANVQLIEGERYSYSISAGKHAINHQLVNGKLKISQNKPRFGWWNLLEQGEIIITIPANAGLDEVSVGAAVGTVLLSDLAMRELEVDVASADVAINRVQSRDVDFSLATGKIQMQDAQFDRLDLNMAAGTVQGTDMVIRGLECNLASGRVQLQGELTGNNQLSALGGDIELRIAGKLEDYSIKLDLIGGSCMLNGESFRGNLARSNANADNHIQGEAMSGNIQIDFE